MTVSGKMLIGSNARFGQSGTFKAFDPGLGAPIEPDFGGAVMADLEEACALAQAAFNSFRETSLEERARFLEAIAQNLMNDGEALVVRTMAETGLPRARLEGERARTVNQLRMFAGVVRDGGFLDVRIDPAMPERAPPRSDLRMRHIPVGPVAVFGASNFPLAFSVAGGDTASAFAAGCPVVVKAHSAHPGAAEIAGRAIQKAVADCGLPQGVFSLLFDSGRSISQALVADPRIKSVGLTGSRGAGVAFMEIAAARPEPIPVFAEMSSINPVIVLPEALKARGEAIGVAFAASLVLGAGQFCTNPGLILALEGPDLEAFIRGASGSIGQAAAATMLSPGIHKAYSDGVAAVGANAAVDLLARGAEGGPYQGQAAFFSTTAEAFIKDHSLRDEMFGAASILVRCKDIDALMAVIDDLEGQLTAAIHADAGDQAVAAQLLPHLENRAGRILFNGFGTGVEVCHAMVHGGPWPATSDTRFTSVGSLAIMRFLRPVCYQDVPADLLPPELKDGNPLHVPRRLNGKLELGEG